MHYPTSTLRPMLIETRSKFTSTTKTHAQITVTRLAVNTLQLGVITASYVHGREW